MLLRLFTSYTLEWYLVSSEIDLRPTIFCLMKIGWQSWVTMDCPLSQKKLMQVGYAFFPLFFVQLFTILVVLHVAPTLQIERLSSFRHRHTWLYSNYYQCWRVNVGITSVSLCVLVVPCLSSSVFMVVFFTESVFMICLLVCRS